MNVENLHVAIGGIVPELDGELPEDMHTQAAARRVVLEKIRKVGREGGYLTKTSEQVLLLSSTQDSQEIEDFNGNEQTRVAHLESSDSPNSRSHCSGVNQRPGESSSILLASVAE